MTRYWARQAWLGGGYPGVRSGVLVEEEGGVITGVDVGVQPPADTTWLSGLLIPGLANAHSHAFHRGLRGRTQARTRDGSFWTWREQMYALADRLDPDTYEALARATFAEMALAGITCVGEFHYLHHASGGRRYVDPNEMGLRLVSAAAAAGIRITLLDTLYLTSTVDGEPLTGAQLRFGDGDVAGWRRRLDGLDAALAGTEHARIGAAAHSVRAVPASALDDIAVLAKRMPVHIHLSEQRQENEDCVAVYDRTPTGLLHDHGLLGPNLTVVHATHLSDMDSGLLGRHAVNVCFCPTTERDLADGIGPARALRDAGARLSLGSDSHAVIDLFEEARAVELDERLGSAQRGTFDADELLVAATAAGHAALGWPDAGRIEPGARADLVTVAMDSVRTAGHDHTQAAAAAVFAATAHDVIDVIVDGRDVVRDGRHVLIPDVARALHDAIEAAWRHDPGPV